MPKNVRNFWIDASIDGYETPLTGGPRGKHDGFTMAVLINDDGKVRTGVTLRGTASKDGHLEIHVDVGDGALVESLMGDGFIIHSKRG